MEMLDIYDDAMRPIGKASRAEAHARGLVHQVVHLWVAVRFRGEAALIFQQRAADKQDVPGYYDIAVGGHMDAGETPEAAVRMMVPSSATMSRSSSSWTTLTSAT